MRLGDVLEDDNFDRVGGVVAGIKKSARSATRHSQKTLAFSSASLPHSAACQHFQVTLFQGDVTYNRPEVSDLKGVEARPSLLIFLPS